MEFALDDHRIGSMRVMISMQCLFEQSVSLLELKIKDVTRLMKSDSDTALPFAFMHLILIRNIFIFSIASVSLLGQ